jgi:secreted trypsin-like serine protease
MRKRLTLAAIAGAAALTLSASPAQAITHGVLDGDDHPYVGLVVFFNADGTPSHRCSGTMISPTVFLTAGHCALGVASAKIWLTPDVTTPVEPGYPNSGNDAAGTPIAHPEFTGALTVPNTHDVGIVLLDAPVALAEYGQLPEAGFLDSLDTARGTQDVTFTIVGYGLQQVVPTLESERIRYQGTSHLQNLRSNLTGGFGLQTSNNGGNWSGGTCSGDSGGPILYSDTNIVVAVNSFGLNANCVGNDFSYRTDIAETRDFLASYLTLP